MVCSLLNTFFSNTCTALAALFGSKGKTEDTAQSYFEACPEDLKYLIAKFTVTTEDEFYSKKLLRLFPHHFTSVSIQLLYESLNIDHMAPEPDSTSHAAEMSYLLKYKAAICKKTNNNKMLIRCFGFLEDQPLIFKERANKIIEACLNNINYQLIQGKIDTSLKNLDCSDLHVTRFPKKILFEYHEYWQSLLSLDLDDNQIYNLPPEMKEVMCHKKCELRIDASQYRHLYKTSRNVLKIFSRIGVRPSGLF